MQEIINSEDSEVLMSIGDELDAVDITLRIFGDNLNPDEITQMLNCQPTEAYKKGHTVKTAVASRTIKTAMWFLTIKKNSDQTLEEQIWELFGKLPKDLEIWENLSKQFETSLCCGAWSKSWNRDVRLSSDLFRQLADRKLSIGLAIYCDCEDKEEK